MKFTQKRIYVNNVNKQYYSKKKSSITSMTCVNFGKHFANSYQVTKIKIVLKQNGTEIIYQAGIANIFNDFFVSVGPKLASTFNFTGTSHISPHTNQTNFNNKSNPFHSAENH